MMHRALTALLLGSVVSCGGRSYEDRRPPEKVFEEYDRAPAQSAGWCTRCNLDTYQGHRCGITRPCATCKREAGARHIHEIAWVCEKDENVQAVRHVCNDDRRCEACRTDGRAVLGERGCDRCHVMLPPSKPRGLTAYCQECNLEVGTNHVHGKTTFCPDCAREAAAAHKCDATRLCVQHASEHALDHDCGTTVYCPRCHRDAGPDHKHGVTEWCLLCQSEKEWPHGFHH